jgi:uncharacterized cupin superfamily protein
MPKPIVNIADVELKPRPSAIAPTGPAADIFEARMGLMSSALGALKLGYNITLIPPGKVAYPAHNHRVNEEMFFIIEGSGEVRIGQATYAVRKGDVIACPPGGVETAHQIKNTGNVDLRFLAVSTRLTPEIVEYPDSGKFGVSLDAEDKAQAFRFIGRQDQNIDYWQGEGEVKK